MKKELNKWQFIFIWGNDFCYHSRRELIFGILSFKTLPEMGFEIQKINYKGFLIRRNWKTKPNINIGF